ncbi:MAG: TIGR00295 family protein [Methanophagales archaeon]|nr:TIGR00295 family protein [Methanophagales archaeon]
MDAGDKKKIRRECVALLRAAGCDEAVVKHCVAVAELALEVARRHNRGVDKRLVFEGALLHDLGRARSHGVEHGFVGGEMAKELGLEERVVRIIQRHVGAGLTAAEAERAGLPAEDFMPETTEEKIVADADNLIDGVRRTSVEEAVEEFKRKLGAGHPTVKRVVKLHEEVQG